MAKELAKKIFSYLFLFIFFAKMAIAVAPLIAITLDAASVNAVIMQLEIEHETPKGAKEVIKDYYQGESPFAFANQEMLVDAKLVTLKQEKHHEAFYPSVPTPPPNA